MPSAYHKPDPQNSSRLRDSVTAYSILTDRIDCLFVLLAVFISITAGSNVPLSLQKKKTRKNTHHFFRGTRTCSATELIVASPSHSFVLVENTETKQKQEDENIRSRSHSTRSIPGVFRAVDKPYLSSFQTTTIVTPQVSVTSSFFWENCLRSFTN